MTKGEPDLTIDLNDLAARLTAAEDRLAILDLEGEYARSWDVGDAAGWAALFAPDGAFAMTAVGDQAASTIRGTAALAAFCTQVDGIYRGLHFIGLPRIALKGDTARAQIHFQWLGLFRRGGAHSGERHARGYYDVTYRKVDGAWKIAHRGETLIAGQIIEDFDSKVRVEWDGD